MSVVWEQRRILPYSATACSWHGAVAVVGVASQPLSAAVNRHGFTACNLQRIIDSDGRRPGAMPTASAVASWTSANHSAIAVYERLLAATAHTAAMRTAVSLFSTPRRDGDPASSQAGSLGPCYPGMTA